MPLCFSIPLFLAACSGSTVSGLDDGGLSNDGSTHPSADLTGTWDLFATSPAGTPSTGTLVVARDTLSLDLGTIQLSYAAHGGTLTVTYTRDGNTSSITTQRAPAAVDLGIMPLDLGGAWTFASETSIESCSASLAPSSWTGSCAEYVAGWPGAVPRPAPHVTYTATRTQQLSSAFGDLGGVWEATDGQGGPGHCTMTVQGSTFATSCSSGTGSLTGTMQLTFSGNDTASGTTSGGAELSAHKQ
jgi:hypothetical protein